MTEEEILRMTPYTYKSTGLGDIIIWIGTNSTKEKYVRISNLSYYEKKRFDGEDTFKITIPDMKIIGLVNKKLITDSVMKNIMDFIELNKKRY